MRNKLLSTILLGISSLLISACNPPINPGPYIPGSYNEVIYVSDIKITVPEQDLVIKDRTDYEAEEFEYYFVTKYEEDLVVQLKAEVLPAETHFPDIGVVYDKDQTFFEIDVVDSVYIHVSFYRKAAARFLVLSTDGNKYQVPVKVLAM